MGLDAWQEDIRGLSLAPNSQPAITSNGGGDTATTNVPENTAAVTTVTAVDADGDTLTYQITGGADQDLFEGLVDTDSVDVDQRSFTLMPTDSSMP